MNNKKQDKKYSKKDEKPLRLNEPDVHYYSNETLPKFDNLSSENLLNKIDGFHNLDSDWDSYGAEPITEIALDTAKKIVQLISTENYFSQKAEINVFPMRDGGVQFEFDRDISSAELEISPKGMLTFILFDDKSNVLKQEQLLEVSDLSIFLNKFAYA